MNLIISKRLLKLIKEPIAVKLTDRALYKTVDLKIILTTGDLITKEILTGDIEIIGCPAPDIGNYFDIVKAKITFHPKPYKQLITECGKWSREGRQEIKISKFLHSVIVKCMVIRGIPSSLSDEFQSKVLNRFIELKAISIGTMKIYEILVSEDVEKIYNLKTATSGVGTLGSSCMRPESEYGCRHLANFYNEVGAKVAYIINEQDRLIARAILWEGVLTKDNKEITVLDRIYGTEQNIEIFKRWAEKQGYYYKKFQSYDNDILIGPKGDLTTYAKYPIDSNFDISEIPFLDTLCVYNEELQDLYLATQASNLTGILCQEIDAEPEDVLCSACGISIYLDDACTIDGEYFCEDCVVYSDYYEEIIRDSEATYSTILHSYIRAEESILIEDLDYYTHIDEASNYHEIEGFYYSDQVARYCRDCGESFLLGTSESDELCSQCAETYEE